MPDNHLPGVDSYWRHYKGGYYEKLDNATHSETQETMVIYRSVCGDNADEKTWVRPASMWNELVEFEGNQVPRFQPVTADDYRTVTKYSLVCPECGDSQLLGEFSTADKALEVMRAEGWCNMCDREFLNDEKDFWLYEDSYLTLAPYYKRHMAGVK